MASDLSGERRSYRGPPSFNRPGRGRRSVGGLFGPRDEGRRRSELKGQGRSFGYRGGGIHGSIEREVQNGGELHFCPGRPCLDFDPGEGYTLHVTRARLWKWTDFKSAGYLEEGTEDRVKALLDAETPLVKPPEKPKRVATPKPSGGKVPGRSVRTPRAKPDPGAKTAPRRKRGAAPTPSGAPASKGVKTETTPPTANPMTGALRERLKKRLDAAKQRVGAGDHQPIQIHSEDEEDLNSGSEDDSLSYAPDDVGLNSGSALLPSPPITTLAKVSRKEKKKKRRKDKELLEEKYGDLNTTSMNSWRGQLVRQTVRAATDNDVARRKRKSSGSKDKTAAEKLTEALSQILGADKGSSSGKRDKKDKKNKKDKKKKKKKRKKRRVRKDGVIESFTSSYSSDSETEEMALSTEDELETPIRKRSRDSPGSILAMLASHVKAQLEQTSAIDMDGTDNAVTGGVKILTYFTLQLKPMFSGHQKELRELHHLAVTMDTLRRGDIARAGDSLAARFMAIHQSLLDQNWSAAKHLELYPMEEATAATSSVILATRKHSRLVAKMQGYPSYQFWGGSGKGRGKGGRGDWSYYGDGKGEYKGKKGKKGDHKGKGKGGTNPSPGGKDDLTNKWKDTKEKE